MNCDPITFTEILNNATWVDWTAYSVLLVAVLVLCWLSMDA